MTKEQFLKNLSPPKKKVDILLDTDAYNEVDDQFAISYLLKAEDRVKIKAICAAPFFNQRSVSPKDGMIKSYNEILKLLHIAHRDDLRDIVHYGADAFMEIEGEPVLSKSSEVISKLASEYSPENPLYIIAIGAITNVASAILLNPDVKENCVVICLCGHGRHICSPAYEFNMRQDIAAARVVFGSGIPLIQLPCGGIVDHLIATKYELKHWLKGKSPLCDYLYNQTVEEAESTSPHAAWSRIIWDISTVAWLLQDEDNSMMRDVLIPSPIPEHDGTYSEDSTRHLIRYVNWVSRDAIFSDLFNRLGSK